MLKSGGGYSSAPGYLANYKSGEVSLPYDQCTPRRVESMLSEQVSPLLVDFKDRMLLSDSELGAVLQNTELPGCYVDPVLEHDPVKYAGFVADMYRCKLVRFDVTPVSKCGLFFVSKTPKPTVRFGCVW